MSAADKVTFIELPSELLVEIICRWIDLKSLVKMDSAACNHKIRSALLQLFSFSHCIFGGATNLSGKCAVDWLRSRKLQVSSLSLSEHFPELVPYFRSHSRSVVHLVGLYMRDLVSLTVRKALLLELSDMLYQNLNLQELRLEDVNIGTQRFAVLRLPHLQLLSLKRSICNDTMLQTIVRTTEVLQHIDIGKCRNITDAGVIAVAQHCSGLRTLGLSMQPVSDGALSQLAELCASITSLDLSANRVVTDLGVRTIAENLHNLRQLSIHDCSRLTDVCLEHLTQHSASTLQVLHATDLPKVRVDVLLALLQKCPCLHTLSLDCELDSYYVDIIPQMGNLQTLVIYSLVSDDVLCLIAQHCKQLRQLGIYSIYMYIKPVNTVPITTYDTRVLHYAGNNAEFDDRIYTEKGLLALLDGLPELRVLAVQEQEVKQGLLMPLAQKLWRRVRPQICFENDWQYFVFDCLQNH